jgi:roadblock/LC7 domain-containing protein
MGLSLDELVKLKGVMVAFEFNAVGECIAYKANFPLGPEMCATIAEYCGLVTRTFSTLADAFTIISEQNWIPQRGWTYTGGDFTVVIGGNGYRGVFAQTDEVDLNELVNALRTQIVSQEAE